MRKGSQDARAYTALFHTEVYTSVAQDRLTHRRHGCLVRLRLDTLKNEISLFLISFLRLAIYVLREISILYGARCLKLHRTLFMIVGLWPYQKPFIWQIQTVFFFGAYSCMLFSQFTPFLTTTCNMECILKRFSYICITFVCILNYYSFYFNSEAVKQMFEHIQFDWKTFKNCDAMKIFEEYLSESYIFTLSLCILFLIGASFITIMESKPIILDVIAPMNESRPRKLEVDIELFVFNEEQYFFFLLVLEGVAAGIGLWSLLTILTFITTLYNAIMQFNDLYDIFVPCGMLVCYLLYMFMANFLAQSYTEHSVGVLESTYDTLWYVAPLPIQKLFLIMQKSIRSHEIMLGGLFVLSVEGFSTLVSSAVSYFTVMHAMRL
ncbi:uncharacterized protein LOC109611419 isoform X2 [Ooceraea biroi]|uniref:uncharacterized protein LOC109611419 isoform X2 n=1 Tax=Ooceraea biroi TaxID=2015173 RepID=UPI000F08C8CD|nr:uncharacterized protein LOC109611419 isoform X2 [Ooceraea biroi]